MREIIDILVLMANCLFAVQAVGKVACSLPSFYPTGDCDAASNPEDEMESSLSSNRTQKIVFDMKTYFKYLYTYSPVNSFGSCGYVSLIQYLSYYDTFLNDNIIPEQYDRTKEDNLFYNQTIHCSPGVLRQDYPSGGTSLYNYIIANEDVDFQAKLMHVVNSSHNNLPSSYSYMTDYEDYDEILDYLFPNQGIEMTGIDYQELYSLYGASLFETYFQNYIASYVRDQLDLGRPVLLQMLGGYNSNTNSFAYNHGVVAYYYDEDGIHYHNGYDLSTSDKIFPNSAFQYIWRAGRVNFGSSYPHVHSNNYIIAGTAYCGCGYSTHVHSFAYSAYNSYYHRKTCSCGIDQLEPHIYQGTEEHCYVCGY